VDEVTDEPLYRDRVCGIDIGKAQMAVTIRVPSDKDRSRRMAETRSFGTTKREVLALADWLRAWQVPAVVMEATGDYWKPVFYRLEAEGLECVLADAKQVKNLPGRPKRDGVPRTFRTADPYRIFTGKDGITCQGNTGSSRLSFEKRQPAWSWKRHGRSRMFPASSELTRLRWVTGCGPIVRIMPVTSRRCSFRSGRGCGNWNARTVNCG
jgi:hypothetical protein